MKTAVHPNPTNMPKKENSINYLQKSLIEKENKNKNVVLTSKASEKIAASKNPNESKEQLYERLHFEKLKNIKEKIEKPKEEKKTGNSIADKLKAFNNPITTKKEEKEKPKEEEKKTSGNIADKLKSFDTKKEEKPKEEEKKKMTKKMMIKC